MKIWTTIAPLKETHIEKLIRAIATFDDGKAHISRRSIEFERPILQARNLEAGGMTPRARLEGETNRVIVDSQLGS